MLSSGGCMLVPCSVLEALHPLTQQLYIAGMLQEPNQC